MKTDTNKTITSPVLEIHLADKLQKADYEAFVPEIERAIKDQGKIRMLVTFEDFQGWTAGALWEDIKFDAKHFNDIERLAIVGEDKWEKGMAMFCKPFTTAKVKFFPLAQIDEARQWIKAA